MTEIAMSMAMLTTPLAQLKPAGPPSRSRRPMILHVRVVAGSGGGPDKNILRSARYMRHSRYDVAAAYIHPHGDPGMQVLAQQARAWGCPLYQIEEAGPMDPHSVRSLLQLCRKLRVAVWHAHDYKSNVLGLLLRALWPMKLVTSVHGWTRETARTRFYYHVDRLCLNRFDHVIAVSPPLVEACLATGVNPEQLTYLPNAVDVEEYPLRQDTAAARQKLGLSNDRLIIGTVGRLSSEKGVDRAVQTIAQLRSQRTDVELHLVGDGPERARLQELAGRLHVQDAVRFWGWQRHLQEFYGAMDLLLLPSPHRGISQRRAGSHGHGRTGGGDQRRRSFGITQRRPLRFDPRPGS